MPASDTLEGSLGLRPKWAPIAQPVPAPRVQLHGALRAVRGHGGGDDVVAVPGDDEERARTDALQHVARVHGADGHVLDGPVHVVARVQQLPVHLLDEHGQRGVREDGPVGQHAEQLDAVPGQATAEHVRQRRVGVQVDLVDDRPGERHAVLREERRVEDDLVDGPAHASLADDDRGRPQARGHDGVGEPDDGAHAGVTGALDEDGLPALDEARVGRLDAGPQVLQDVAADEGLREATGDVHRAHELVGVGQAERGAHEDGVLVGRDVVDERVALPDRLGEGGREAPLDEGRQEPQRERGLAAVHARGRQVDLPHAHRVRRRRAGGTSAGDAEVLRPSGPGARGRQAGSMGAVNTVVFDLGGVLVDWDPRYLLRKVMPGREAEMEIILADVLNHDWNLARDHGDSWPDAMAELAVRYPQWAEVFRDYDERWAETLAGSHEDTVAVLRELHERRVPLYALSNWSAEKFPHAEARYEWLTWFDGVVVSGRVKLAKPDPAIFRYLLDTYGLRVPDILFVDDHEPNIVAARALGMATHHFRDAARLRADLVARGFLDAAPAAGAMPAAGTVAGAGHVAAGAAGGDRTVAGSRTVAGAAAGDPTAAQAS